MAIIGLFVIGGVMLYFVAHPFYEAMLATALALGVSQFVFVQWVAPFLSEFPEKVTAFNWARTGKKAPLALMNMVSSNINQWTVLAAMIPIVYSISVGKPSSIPFDAHHQTEILLTIVQSFLGMLLIANLQFRWYEAVGPLRPVGDPVCPAALARRDHRRLWRLERDRAHPGRDREKEAAGVSRLRAPVA